MRLFYLKLILILSLMIFTCASSSRAFFMIPEQRAESSVEPMIFGFPKDIGRMGRPRWTSGWDGRFPVIRKIQMPSAAEHIMMGQATMMQEMMEIDIEILELLKDMAKEEEMRQRIEKLIIHYEELLKKHKTIIEKMMR